MTDQVFKPTNKKDMKAAFPIDRLDKVDCEPDIHWFMKAHKQLQECAKTQTSAFSSLGLIFLTCSPQTYATMTTEPYTQVRSPDKIPNLTAGMTDHEREQRKILWQVHQKEIKNIQTIINNVKI